jgi:hypothetical protein
MSGIPWSEEEIVVLEIFYPNTRHEELLELLPGRSIKSIQVKAHLLKISRNKEFTKFLMKESFERESRLTWDDYLERHKKYLPILKEYYDGLSNPIGKIKK